jgi:proteasome lid subunit RPN8/RPN11
LKSLSISTGQIAVMEQHVSNNAPEEACGLLAGRDQMILLTILITNQLHSPVRYNMDPVELLKALMDIENHKLELLASFHSHPNGPLRPSQTDIVEYQYPGTAMLIWSKMESGWQVKAFEILQEQSLEIQLQILN